MLGSTLKRSEAAKYLGITLDDKLTWKEHIEALTEKLSKTIQAFKIIKNYVNEDQKRALNFAYIYSRIQYGIEIYCSALQKDIKHVQIKQNRALKVLFKKDYTTPTRQLHKDLNLLLVKDIGQLNTLKFVHKERAGNVPDAFNGYFSEIKQHHDVPTRQANNLHIQRSNNWGKSP